MTRKTIVYALAVFVGIIFAGIFFLCCSSDSDGSQILESSSALHNDSITKMDFEEQNYQANIEVFDWGIRLENKMDFALSSANISILDSLSEEYIRLDFEKVKANENIDIRLDPGKKIMHVYDKVFIFVIPFSEPEKDLDLSIIPESNGFKIKNTGAVPIDLGLIKFTDTNGKIFQPEGEILPQGEFLFSLSPGKYYYEYLVFKEIYVVPSAENT